VKGTNTILFVHKQDIPHDHLHDITYGQFVCTIRPEKNEPNCTRLVVGGDRINYPCKVATPTADMLVAKILFNSVVSTPGARFMTMDISNFYLNAPLDRPEFIRMSIGDIPDEIVQEYKLLDLLKPDGYVYIKIVLACMACRMPDSLPMPCSKNGSTNTVTDKANSSQACGCMIGALSGSPLWWMILESNTLAKSMRCTSKQ
jgi:hypothetical protein